MGGWRFVTKPCRKIGICTVFCYPPGLKIRKIVLRIMWTFPFMSQINKNITQNEVKFALLVSSLGHGLKLPPPLSTALCKHILYPWASKAIYFQKEHRQHAIQILVLIYMTIQKYIISFVWLIGWQKINFNKSNLKNRI